MQKYSITSGVFLVRLLQSTKTIVFFVFVFFSLFTGSTSQLIVHSSRVMTPKRHNSESVLYMSDDQISISSSNNSKKITQTEQSSRDNHRLFPVSTYTEANTEPETKHHPQSNQQTSDKQSIK